MQMKGGSLNQGKRNDTNTLISRHTVKTAFPGCLNIHRGKTEFKDDC